MVERRQYVLIVRRTRTQCNRSCSLTGTGLRRQCLSSGRSSRLGTRGTMPPSRHRKLVRSCTARDLVIFLGSYVLTTQADRHMPSCIRANTK